jgi:menaquinone-dependent protoporphyrinogen oxidase
MKTISRRQFVVNGSMTIGGLITASAVPVGLISPSQAFAGDVKFIESSCESKGKKILIAYESICGTTSGVAQSIGDVFCKQGAQVDVLHMENVKDISSYHGVVLGSAVKASSWNPGAIKFVKANKKHLQQIPTVYFLTCLALYFDTKGSRETAMSYFNPVLKAVPDVSPVTMHGFAGVLDYSKLNMMYRMVMKSKMKKKGIPEGDFRDFDKIETWAKNIAWPIMISSTEMSSSTG